MKDYFLQKWLFKNPLKNLVVDGSSDPFRETSDKPYEYVLNSDGLRSVEFSEKPEIIALGCSMTFGSGLFVEDRWASILEKHLKKDGYNYKVGVIAYHGGSAHQSISGLFSILSKYQYKPKYIFCNFPGIDRYSFISPEEDRLVFGSTYAQVQKKLKSSYPYDWFNIIPHEWAYYINFEYVRILEEYCRSNKIVLVWSTWSSFGHLGKDFETFCLENFSNYYIDPSRELFPNIHSGKVMTKDYHDYKMFDWESIRCHEEVLNKYGDEYFNTAYDRGGPDFTPHWGIHKQTHWAEFYRSFIKE
jgi:hypothetical protein